MADYERVFTNKLKVKLQRKIRRIIFINVVDDTMIVDIVADNAIRYRYLMSDIASRIAQECSVDNVYHKVIDEYRRFIITKFLN